MKGPRLLPIVIAAIAALILFKGIGLLTNGGYVLVGTNPAAAASQDTSGDATPAPAVSSQDATMGDTSPTLTDSAPTLPIKTDSAGAGDGTTAPSQAPDVTPPMPADQPADASTATQQPAVANAVASSDATAAAAPRSVADCPPQGTADAGAAAAPGSTAAPAAGSNATAGAPAAGAPAKPEFSGFDFVKPPVDCTPSPGVNAEGDALPLVVTGDGKKVPLASISQDGNSQDQILERLADRRAELDKREADLNMRQTLVEAAEKKLDERTAELQALEDKVNALVKEKDTAEQQQFVSIVAMYEAMKPKDAAAIFDQLEMPVLLKVARAMNPRKMGPILAVMSTTKAKDLTANLAADQGQQTVDIGQGGVGDLPQIVGQ